MLYKTVLHESHVLHSGNSQQIQYRVEPHTVSPHVPAMLCGKPPECAAVAKSLFLTLGIKEIQKTPYAV